MKSTDFKTTTISVRDSKTGQFVTVKGAGALKGKMTISKKVDLTKPISGPSPSVKVIASRVLSNKSIPTAGVAGQNAAKR